MSCRFASGLPPAPARGLPPNPRLLWAIWPEVALYAALILFASSIPAHAAGSGMPWDAPLQRILESVEGPVAKVSAVLVIIMTGLSLAFGDMSGGFRRLIQIVFGLSIILAATPFFLWLLESNWCVGQIAIS